MHRESLASLHSLGRYEIYGKIASGGMANVYYGRQHGDIGFSRVVAVKRMLPRFVNDPQFVAMFLDEATLASRIQHPNVVATLDLVADGREILIVMEYVRALSLALLLDRTKDRGPVAVDVACSIMIGVLAGLHAAHEARGKKGELLGIVHRDVSPHNVLIGSDGVPRIMDFGIAKATHQLHVTGDGQIKGKLSYMAPEQLVSGGRPIDRGADVFTAGVVLWGLLAGERLFPGGDVAVTMAQVLRKEVPPLARYRSDVPPALDEAIRRALERDRDLRWATARDFEEAIAAACAKLATSRAVGAWVESLGGDVLAERDAEISRMEGEEAPIIQVPVVPSPPEDPEEMLLDDPTVERGIARASLPVTVVENRPEPTSSTPPPLPRASLVSWRAAGIAAAGIGVVVLVALGISTLRHEGPAPVETTAPAPAATVLTTDRPNAREPPTPAIAPAASASSAVDPRERPSANPLPARPATSRWTPKETPSAGPSTRLPADPGFIPERP